LKVLIVPKNFENLEVGKMNVLKYVQQQLKERLGENYEEHMAEDLIYNIWLAYKLEELPVDLKAFLDERINIFVESQK
jgi:hypothetical protein